MTLKGRFKGTNSLGYENGKLYSLHFSISDNYIMIHNFEGKGKLCRYNGLKKFLENWDVV